MTLSDTYPCPKCGQYDLVYDGMLAWRSGPRPPRKMARKDVGFSRRSDYERQRLYHCQHCEIEFYEDVEQRRQVHLYEEGVFGRYSYDKMTENWQFRAYGKGVHKRGRQGVSKAERRRKTEKAAAIISLIVLVLIVIALVVLLILNP